MTQLGVLSERRRDPKGTPAPVVYEIRRAIATYRVYHISWANYDVYSETPLIGGGSIQRWAGSFRTRFMAKRCAKRGAA